MMPDGTAKVVDTVVDVVVLDVTATGFPTVFCSGGRRGLEVELAPNDLVRLTGATVAAITSY